MPNNKCIMLVFANGWPIGDPLRIIDQKWLKKLQTDSNGRLQISYLDISGLLNPQTGCIAGFSSWQEEREHVDIFWGTFGYVLCQSTNTESIKVVCVWY